MKLIIFLGNPGKKYEKTRHNAGWMCGDVLQKKWGFSPFTPEKKFFGDVSAGTKNGEKVLFLKPTTFMNLSGKSALAASQFYKIDPQDILVIFDDKDQDFGNVKFRESGSAGGHNGIKDIIRAFGTENIARVKIGVDSARRTDHNISTSDFVLADFTTDELNALQQDLFPLAEEKIENWLHKKSPTESE
jgi:PTH1 family peptidyl-tRNA hydrolase